MLFVSDSAKNQIASIRQSGQITEDYFIRVSVTSGGCSGLTYKMDFDNESQPEDQVFEDNGIKVVTDLKSFLYLFESTLEFSGGLSGKGFHFTNPNASRTCGCGESFAVWTNYPEIFNFWALCFIKHYYSAKRMKTVFETRKSVDDVVVGNVVVMLGGKHVEIVSKYEGAMTHTYT